MDRNDMEEALARPRLQDPIERAEDFANALVLTIKDQQRRIAHAEEEKSALRKEIERLNSDRIQPSTSFQERMQRADEAVGRLHKAITAAIQAIDDEQDDIAYLTLKNAISP